MKALITGASSGIGKEIAFYLGNLGYDLVVVSQDKDKLDVMYKDLKTKVTTFAYDLSIEENCYKLYEETKNMKIDILVNNAGFGDCGEFIKTSLDKEKKMIDLNIKCVHILTKLFLRDFVERDYGKILNVASIAGFMPGPYMATYYATKAYVLNLTVAVNEELKQKKSKVRLFVLCPGPVNTNFNKVANVKFSIGSLDSKYVAKYAVNKMFDGKTVIIPGASMKANRILTKVLPQNIILEITSRIQHRRIK